MLSLCNGTRCSHIVTISTLFAAAQLLQLNLCASVVILGNPLSPMTNAVVGQP